MVRKHSKLAIAILIVAALIATGIVALVLMTPRAAYANGTVVKEPYSILIGGKEVAVVNGKSTGKKVMKDVAASYTPKGAVLKKVSYDTKVKIQERKLSLFEDAPTVKTRTEAVQAILDGNTEEDPMFTVTTVSEKYKTKKTDRKVTFKYDSTLSAFESKVQDKGKAGTSRLTYRLTSRNGKLISKKKTAVKVLEDPENAVVLTGNQNMPTDLKWSDYDEYTSKLNDELGVKISKEGIRYLGNPYKLGGNDLYHGIDCVAFVRAMYQKYGITLPKGRTAIGHYGRAVSLSQAKAGDIVYYGNHVAIYMGNGKVIHAIRKGISISKVNFRKIVSIRRGY